MKPQFNGSLFTKSWMQPITFLSGHSPETQNWTGIKAISSRQTVNTYEMIVSIGHVSSNSLLKKIGYLGN